MRKTIYTLALLSLSFALPVNAGIDEGVTYLKNQTQDDWVVMALAAAGQNPSAQPLQTFTGTSATDYSKRILALTATGDNPTVFTDSDLVQGLRDLSQQDQIGETYLLNDDAWGILALRSAGVATSDPVITSAKNYLLANQNPDGGWSWGVGFDSDTNDTSAVMMALLEAGVSKSSSVITSAVNYLKSVQEDDGGWAYEPVWDSDAASTAWVITALNKLGQSDEAWAKGEATPLSFLLSLQTDNGSFKWVAADSTGSASMTAFSVIALSGQSFPVKKSFAGSQGRQVEKINLVPTISSTSLQGEAGQQVEYTISVENKGPDSATLVEIKNIKPADFGDFGISASAGSFNAASNTWNLPLLNVGDKADLTIKLSLPNTAQEVSWQIKSSAWQEENDWRDNDVVLNLLIVKTPEPQVLGESVVACNTSITNGEANKKLAGFALRVEGGATWYYDPVSLKRYCLQDADAAYKALGLFGLGITNADLEKIPVAGSGTPADKKLVERLKGRILLQVEDLGQAWYVDPRDGSRHYLADGLEVTQKLLKSSLIISDYELRMVNIYP